MLLVCFSCSAFVACAQEQTEDAIYLKNGNIYRGTIIEQVPGESYTIQILGGSVMKIKAEYIERITHEKKAPTAQPYFNNDDKGSIYRNDNDPRNRRSPPPFVYRKKGYFFQGQLMVGLLEGGFRIINGYKFGQFGYLGLGVGIDGVVGSINVLVNGGGTEFSGAYVPLFLYYTGDILKKRITPFYALELGYAFRFQPSSATSSYNYYNQDPNEKVEGGMTGAVGLGVRFFSRKNRKTISLSINLDVKSGTNRYTYYNSNGSGQYYPYTQVTNAIMYFPAVKLGIGF